MSSWNIPGLSKRLGAFALVAAATTGCAQSNGREATILSPVAGDDPIGDLIGDIFDAQLEQQPTIETATLTEEAFTSPTRIPAELYDYHGDAAVGTIFVHPETTTLYFVASAQDVIAYPIAVGRNGAAPDHSEFVGTGATYWPSWTPTPNMRARDPSLPQTVRGGPNNPHGAGKIYFYTVSNFNADVTPNIGGYTFYGIHGTNNEDSIGTQASAGCYRMFNLHITDLIERLPSPRILVEIIDTEPEGLGAFIGYHQNLPETLPAPRTRPASISAPDLG